MREFPKYPSSAWFNAYDDCIKYTALQVQEGIDFLLFNLIILGCLVDRSGLVWRRNTDDLYLIETMPIFESQSTNNRDKVCDEPYLTSKACERDVLNGQ
ncbi:hypothetical protein DPMN_042228 [Dreissena polymorpha]|uniref:Uncharacterized protein n=1 Tax=Dreissena polymorpha TaxID=45954 RepID=A0A9D4D1P6_DREPO|nr:hypothetical protein DPMN_042228 [Dreissena polymorpha]